MNLPTVDWSWNFGRFGGVETTLGLDGQRCHVAYGVVLIVKEEHIAGFQTKVSLKM